MDNGGNSPDRELNAASTNELKHKRSRRLLINPDGVKLLIEKAIGKDVARVLKLSRGIDFEHHDVTLSDQTQLSVKVFFPSVSPPVVNSEVATIRHLAHHTSVPVPKIICFNSDNGDENDLFIATEKVQGVNLQSVYHEIPSLQKEAIVTKVARWILELYHLRFDKIGSLHLLPEDPSSAAVGPISTDVWNINGRARIEGIDRGPWPTAKDYFKACSQRELDCLKPFLTQEGSEEYKRTVEESRIQVEYSMELMDRIIDNCEGLDEDDPYFAPFAVNARAFELENIFVSEDDFSKIVLIEGWRNTTIRPLWHCAHLPSWLTISLYESDDTSDKKALENTFRKTVSSLDRSFLLGLDAGGTRQSLEEVCNYDALKYGYIVTPTLQSISMTLPKKLDIEGIREVLDPHTDVGRVARTMSVTQGSAWESMSMNIQFPPLSPSKRSPTSPSKSYPSQPVLNLTLPAGRSQTTKQGLMKTPEATGVDDVSGGPVNTSAEKDETPPGSTTKFTPSDQVDTDNQEENIRSSYAPADGDGRDGSRVQGSQLSFVEEGSRVDSEESVQGQARPLQRDNPNATDVDVVANRTEIHNLSAATIQPAKDVEGESSVRSVEGDRASDDSQRRSLQQDNLHSAGAITDSAAVHDTSVVTTEDTNGEGKLDAYHNV